MNLWLEHLAAYLQAGGFGTVGTDIFRAQLPSQWDPKTLVTVLTPGPGVASLEPLGIRRPRVQITHRCRTWDTAWAKALQVHEYLNKTGPIIWGTVPAETFVQWISAVAPPFSIGMDENQAFRVVTSYELELGAL